MKFPVCLASLLVAAIISLGLGHASAMKGSGKHPELFVAVRDRNNRAVQALKAPDFQVTIDGAVVPISLRSNLPRQFLLLFDFSTSMFGGFAVHGDWDTDESGRVTGSRLGGVNREWARRGVVSFGNALGPADSVRLASFGARSLVTPASRTGNDLASLWTQILQDGGPSPIWDAVDAGISLIAHGDGRPILILVTDGRPAGSNLGFDELLVSVGRSPTTVYVTGPRAALGSSVDDPAAFDPVKALDRLAQTSAGRLVSPSSGQVLGDLFRWMLDDLHAQYTLEMPETVSTDAKIEVRVLRAGVTVMWRRGLAQ